MKINDFMFFHIDSHKLSFTNPIIEILISDDLWMRNHVYNVINRHVMKIIVRT